jgi:hypothetical protein
MAVVAGALAAPASADPATNPCELKVTFLCRFMPIAPDLEGEVDLTTRLPPAPPPESLPVINPCASGCV